MLRRVLGTLLLIWGLAIVWKIQFVPSPVPTGNQAYDTGREFGKIVAFVFGTIFIVAGAYYAVGPPAQKK